VKATGLRASLLALVAAVSIGTARAEDFYDIHVILPLTGGTAFLGTAEQAALQRYEKLVAASGGIHGKTLRFVYHDDQSSPQTAVQLMNKVKASNPAVVLGSAQVALCNAMAPLVRSGPLLYCFSPGVEPATGGFMFSSSTSTRDLMSGVLTFIGKNGMKRFGMITSTDASGQDAYKNIKLLAAAPNHKDVELVAEAQFNPTDVSASAQIQRIKAANPDILIVWTTGSPAGTVFKAIRDAGLEIPVATTNGNQTYAQMEQYASFLPKDLYIPAAEWPNTDRPQSPEIRAAKEKFFKAYDDGSGVKPDGPATYAWDPANLVVEALRALKPGATGADLRAYLSELQGVSGINGPYDFRAVPNRGLNETNVVMTKWDPKANLWAIVSDPLGKKP